MELIVEKVDAVRVGHGERCGTLKPAGCMS
jgi:hypothetical protein